MDLYYLSGRLATARDIHVADCMADGIRPARCLDMISRTDPDYIITLTGHVSWNEDIEFLKTIPRRPGRKIIATGDILLDADFPAMAEGSPIDALLLDFTTDDILHYINEEYDKIKYMNFRSGDAVVVPGVRRENGGEFEMPLPLLDKFPYRRYHFPFLRHHPFGIVLTDYGCPYSCRFCAMNSVGHKISEPDGLLQIEPVQKGTHHT